VATSDELLPKIVGVSNVPVLGAGGVVDGTDLVWNAS
jgi:NAD(P)H-dependent flavin oxidoreductase YrpB (nitropropane dioxygenase family)